MELLTYKTLNDQNYAGYLLPDAPERVLQFGEGNFLRAFVDYFIDVANETCNFNTKVVLTQPIAPGLAPQINAQEGLYTLYLRGFENGQKKTEKRVISCVSRCINPYEDYAALLACAHNPELRYLVSNTTEAGIVHESESKFDDAPPKSFPAKLTRFLYERWTAFSGAPDKGFVILSCELIDNNGKELQRCVEAYMADWNLPEAFVQWVGEANLFCSTLVDRIVTGYPRAEAAALNAENGYEDNLLDTGELFGFWVIEGPDSLKEELPFAKAGLPVLVTNDHTPYKKRKVRILNGAHTSMVLAAYLSGQDIVRNCMQDDVIKGFMNQTIYDEIMPTLTLPQEELKEFAASVADRFNNPFIDHALLSIALNSTAKWKARVLPSLKGYLRQTGNLPACLTFSLAAYIAFYRCVRLEDDAMVCRRTVNGGNEYRVQDDRWVLEFFNAHKEDTNAALVQAVCANTEMWGEDLTTYASLVETVTQGLNDIDTMGAYAAMQARLQPSV